MKVGDEIAFITPRGKRVSYRLSAIYDANVMMLSEVTLTDTALVRDWESKDVVFALVVSSPGTDAEALKQAEEKALNGFPTAKPQTIQDFKDQQYSGIDTVVYIDLPAARAVGDRGAARRDQHARAVGARAHA